MSRLKFLLALSCLFVGITHAAFERLPDGPRPLGMACTGVALRWDAWAAIKNPALLGSMAASENSMVALGYTPGLFGLRELQQSAVCLVQPTSFGTLGLSASQFGFSLYRETAFALAYGRPVSRSVCLGIKLTWYGLSIEGYGHDSSIGIDAGIVLELSDAFSYGCSLSNMNNPTLGRERDPIPQNFSMGVCYRPLVGMSIEIEGSKDLRFPPELHCGIEYEILSEMALRIGTSTEPSVYSAGIGFSVSFFSLDYAYVSHLDLGPTHHLALCFRLGGW